MLLRTILLVGIALVEPAVAAAQQTSAYAHVTLSAGATVYDRSGSGTTGIYALRGDFALYPSVLLEAGLSYARRRPGETFRDVFIPGVQVQFQGTSGQFSPFVGLGTGLTVETRSGGKTSQVSFSPSFAAGLRIALTDGAGLCFEGRLHGVGADFSGLYSEFTGGLSVAW